MEKKPKFLQKEEIEKLLDNSNGLYPVLYTFLKTGLRKSELINLKWKDIDFKRKYITVESKEDWRTKTGNTREIPITDDLVEILNKLPRTSGYVFLNSNSRKYGFHLTKRVKRLAKSIGISDMIVHTLRHTFISHLVMNGGRSTSTIIFLRKVCSIIIAQENPWLTRPPLFIYHWYLLVNPFQSRERLFPFRAIFFSLIFFAQGIISLSIFFTAARALSTKFAS